eukprot:TRINITY_DN8501_c0_g1_i1.p1 TRINITY_DN8501_c0_g1~~TRINITY_DN8501_c0_g1_i1.p1  ORF type:complete len:177 (+),score=21.99 TRINITY_DN8501_c0_g1_i1:62-532(+)
MPSPPQLSAATLRLLGKENKIVDNNRRPRPRPRPRPSHPNDNYNDDDDEDDDGSSFLRRPLKPVAFDLTLFPPIYRQEGVLAKQITQVYHFFTTDQGSSTCRFTHNYSNHYCMDDIAAALPDMDKETMYEHLDTLHTSKFLRKTMVGKDTFWVLRT